MSRDPYVIVLVDHDDVSIVARLAPVADQLKIRCLASPTEATSIVAAGLAIANIPLHHWPTITPRQAQSLDPWELVELARNPTTSARALDSDPDIGDSRSLDHQQSQMDNHSDVAQPVAQQPREVATPTTTNSPQTPAQFTGDAARDHCDFESKAIDHPDLKVALTKAPLVPNPSSHQHERETPANGEPGCCIIPVIGVDPTLNAQVSCLLAQLCAEVTETILLELDSHGFQRFLHDTALEAPSLIDLLRASTTTVEDIAGLVPARGYRLIPQPLLSNPQLSFDVDRIATVLNLFAELGSTLVVQGDRALIRTNVASPAEGVELFTDGLLGQCRVLVVTVGAGVTSLYGLVNLIRDCLHRFGALRDLLLVVVGRRGELRRGRDLHGLLEEAIPESVARLGTLQIVALGNLELDDYHQRVSTFPASVVRPLRPFVTRITTQPRIVPELRPINVTHTLYERVDPLLNFFAQVQD